MQPSLQLDFQTDWLASEPVFYNEKTGRVSNNIQAVIDWANLEFHPEGLKNYLDFGYSVFEQTPLRHVKFLPPCTSLKISDGNQLVFEQLEEPVAKWLGKTTPEAQVVELLFATIQDWENSVQGEIVIPTSGGYDSRLLNLAIKAKERIRSFTYGVSEDPNQSFEVVHARRTAEVLGTQWQAIPLGDFHHYFDDWEKLFGVSTHAHGMYQIEFYKKMLPFLAGNNPLLSGIIGDAWAGSVKVAPIERPEELTRLGYTHGMQADSHYSLLPVRSNGVLENYFVTYRERLASPEFRVVEAMRRKMVLLSYLLIVPRSLGLQPWSPYLLPEVALAMLTIPAERRANRIWQKELFQKYNLDLEAQNLKVSYQNNLNHQAMRRVRLKPLEVSLLRELIQPDYVNWINRQIGQQGWGWDTFWKLQTVPGVRGMLYRLGIREQRLKAYLAYLTLKPLENVLRRRNQFSKGEG